MTFLNSSSVLFVENLSKSFDGKAVVKNCTYAFKPGIFGIVGPNGIGKSTFLSLLSGTLLPDAGNVFINGISLQTDGLKAKSMLNCAPDADTLYPFMTGAELLELVCIARSINDSALVDSVLEGFSLTPYAHFNFGELSEGTRRKFALTATLLNRSEVLILDEPTNALDEKSVAFLEQEILRRKPQAVILIATHDIGFLASINATQLDAATLLNVGAPESSRIA